MNDKDNVEESVPVDDPKNSIELVVNCPGGCLQELSIPVDIGEYRFINISDYDEKTIFYCPACRKVWGFSMNLYDVTYME